MKRIQAVKILFTVIAFFVLGYWLGYWHGRTYELYISAQRYGVIPETVTWKQFLNEPSTSTPH